MFDVGFAELLIIAVVGLVVLGPDKLPVAVRTVGLWVGKARRTLSGIQSEISEELRLEEMKRQVSIQKEELDQELEEMQKPFSEALGDNSPLEQNVTEPAKNKTPIREPDVASSTSGEETQQTEDKPTADDRS